MGTRTLRKLFPASGLAYELFDAAVFVGALAALWYVTTAPSETTRTALSDTLSLLLAPRYWGIGMLVAALVALVLSYGHWRAVRAGYVLLACACGAWSASLVVGVVVAQPEWQYAGKTLGSALIYMWVCRRLVTNIDHEAAPVE